MTAVCRLNATAHVLATTQGRLNFTMVIRASGDLHAGAIVFLYAVVDQCRITFAAGCIHRHSTFVAFISCHRIILCKELRGAAYVIFGVGSMARNGRPAALQKVMAEPCPYSRGRPRVGDLDHKCLK